MNKKINQHKLLTLELVSKKFQRFVYQSISVIGNDGNRTPVFYKQNSIAFFGDFNVMIYIFFKKIQKGEKNRNFYFKKIKLRFKNYRGKKFHY